jgi:NAD(P)-dependent dehydrogenase (short-subunit alcohol dehydrogenase family)
MTTTATPTTAATTDATTTAATAIVTGSTSGIGAAIARALAADGATVLVTGRDEARGDAVVADIRAGGGSALFLPSDLAGPPDSLRAFATAATEALGGRVDVLVHNAGLCPPVDTPGLSDADLDATLAVNVRAPHVLTAALAPAMAGRGSGAIVVVGSWMARVGSPFVGLYSASKAAAEQLARSWAAEFGPRGVRVNAIAPGVVRTPINAGADAALEALTSRTPVGRVGTPDDIARAVAWVVSDRADFVQGAVLAVDGGISGTRL